MGVPPQTLVALLFFTPPLLSPFGPELSDPLGMFSRNEGFDAIRE